MASEPILLSIPSALAALIVASSSACMAGSAPLLAATLLFLTPMSFLVSVIRNSRLLVDRLAFALGFAVGPLLTWGKIDLALLWTGLIGGTVAYAAARLYAARKRRAP